MTRATRVRKYRTAHAPPHHRTPTARLWFDERLDGSTAIQHRRVLTQLRCGVQAGARIVEVHVPPGVDATELPTAKIVKDGCRGVFGMRGDESRVGGPLAHTAIVRRVRF